MSEYAEHIVPKSSAQGRDRCYVKAKSAYDEMHRQDSLEVGSVRDTADKEAM